MSVITKPNVPSLLNVDFEVFGKVQGVYFRKHTQRRAMELGLKGWVMNTAQGTVVGQLQGPPPLIKEMKTWLQKIGSPKSKIEKAVFKNESHINTCAFRSFDIRR
ncbi:Acylphosphatase-2 [Eumeta japonica]|uniref:Acylphosphatase n=1 Tax=Eumeta variegata TaxID=151549 RepID=A0A4C1XT79_EUMVA|nr:Acylphosphatase-2 [Eumeta japonica]